MYPALFVTDKYNLLYLEDFFKCFMEGFTLESMETGK